MKATKNIRAVQLLLGQTKLVSTLQYLGVEVEDALDNSEQIDVQLIQPSGRARSDGRLATGGNSDRYPWRV